MSFPSPARCWSIPTRLLGLLVFATSLIAQTTVAQSVTQATAEVTSDYTISPVSGTKVQFTDSFWRPRIDTNREKTITYCFDKCEEFGRMENFRVAAGKSDKEWAGEYGFNDSDISKVLEGAAYCLMTEKDEKLESYLDDMVDLFAMAQEPDGYLYTLWTAGDKAPRRMELGCSCHGEPWGNIPMGHQLYNLGHMYEAAYAHWQATGKTSLLDVSTRSAELLLRKFGPGKLELPPGHQEVELGLVKLYRATGNEDFLELTKFFLEQRGVTSASRDSVWGPYSQDHKPVLEQDEAVGHAVRASYMYAAMTDIAALTGDEKYTAAVDNLWEDVVSAKMYITGGVGATNHGEAFGARYEMPNLTAYNETCASIAQCYWNHRMFLLHGDAKYMDVLERVLYNGTLSGVSMDGDRFFYPNPLASDGRHERQAWFACSCCPTNICRFIPSVPGYTYAVDNNDLYVNLFVESTTNLTVADKNVVIEQKTNYPWDGKVRLSVKPEVAGQQIALKIRIPGWARNEVLPSKLYSFTDADAPAVTFAVGDEPATSVAGKIDNKGFLVIDRKWDGKSEVVLDIPMPVRRIGADERVKADVGRVAFQRGPLVYCVEHPEAPKGKVHSLIVSDDTEVGTEFNKELLGGIQTLQIAGSIAPAAEGEEAEAVEFTAIPYYSWAHRGRGDMAVWLATSNETLVTEAIEKAKRDAERKKKEAERKEREAEAKESAAEDK